MQNSLLEKLLADTDKFYEHALKIRRHVHRFPELSTKERGTIKYITEIFNENNINHTVLPDGAGIVATVGHGGKCTGLRAELDALPVTEMTGLEFASQNAGVMHACGHDVHLASVVGTMLVLKEYEDELPFTVKAFLQPAEESVGGAEKMISLGCMKDPDADEVYGIHVDPTIPVGSITLMPGVMNAAVKNFEINVRGVSCHGAHPDQGIDAIVVSAEIITALQSIVSRSFAPTTPVVLTIGTIQGGTRLNIVCGEVNMTGTLRALSTDVIETLAGRLEDRAQGIARSFGAEAEVIFHAGYPELHNDPEKTALLSGRCRKLLGEDKVIPMNEPSLGADDFAYFTKAAPGCYFNVGCRGEGQGSEQVLHSEYFSPDEECMKVAYKAFLMCITQ
ncbi:MAG: amidohydrolase [Eubacteriaceae bacterium]|nr:amidohydrolase [Eubacteriaceae bacterium]